MAKSSQDHPGNKIVRQQRAPRGLTSSKKIKSLTANAPSAAFPRKPIPMLATLVTKPFDSPDWIFEVKWDGYRALALMKKGKVELKSRNDKSFAEKFYPVTDSLKKWKIDAVVDGEIVVLNENGISNFGKLQNWRSEADGPLHYYLFDILWLNRKSLVNLPLKERKEILQSLKLPDGNIRISEHLEASGIDFFESAKKMGLEGIMAKKAESSYEEGIRSENWLKIKANKRQEMVIGGYTKNERTAKQFSSLLVGVYAKKKLVYTGKVGTGFNDAMQKKMIKQFQPLITRASPFTTVPDVNKPSRFRPDPPKAIVTWLKPQLVCEVSYTEMTSDGVMRHPSFEGMREDKKAASVKLEIPKPPAATHKKSSIKKTQVRSPEKSERKTLLNPNEAQQVKKINGHELKFTNLHKLYWPKEKITKRDLINYYYQVAPVILPYLKNRQQSMHRHPDGINGQHFFFKDITGKAPEWIETYKYHSDADNRTRNYLVAKDEASLLYMASLGCIEMNPWHSRVEKEDYPDWCILDLDPWNNSFEKVIEAARVTKEILDEIGVPGYPKTSGSTGMHIYIPLGAKYTYEQSKEFARVIARLVHQQIPQFTSIERSVKDRKGKMYIDFLQNRPQATISAPYSLRPKPGATVSMPLQWDEVKRGLKMTDFHLFNAKERISSLGDLFKPVLGKGINLSRTIKKLDALFAKE